MKIKAMTATFGRLDRARLEPGEGLNVIYAPNEGGKSTWAAFWKLMLYGLDTRERDRRGFLADKNRYQPWSGAPMEGELVLDWQGQDFTLRRGPRGNVPFGAFSAVRTGTGEPIPGLDGSGCGELLTGAGRELFERSAFIGGGSLTVTTAPELERRITALVSSGEEGTSFSQAAERLREWSNRRRVNRSVGLIPKLEGELDQVGETLDRLKAVSGEIARLEEERAALEGERDGLAFERHVHRRLAQRALNSRFAQAGEELAQAREQLDALTRETEKFGALPDKEELKSAQGELQYLKVLDEEIKQGAAALEEARQREEQARTAAQDSRFSCFSGFSDFSGLSGEEAAAKAAADRASYQEAVQKAKSSKRHLYGVMGTVAGWAAGWLLIYLWKGHLWDSPLVLTGLLAGAALLSLILGLRGRKRRETARKILEQYGVQTPEELSALAQDYRERCQAAEKAAHEAEVIQAAVDDRQSKRDAARAELLDFVHRFAPEASDLFGCSAALSRALNLDHDLALARERVAGRRRRREDLAAQGGQDFDTLELIPTPERTPVETDRALAAVTGHLDQVNQALNQALGRQAAMGDPAALAARREELEGELARRREELEALGLALDALEEANSRLRERFSPELNRLAGSYFSRLTGERYQSLTLNRQLEGMAARGGDILPRRALSLSRGAADQLYLAVRLAVCRLCLPELPPILLDDALVTFDDSRLELALDLLRELAREQQVLLFTCQNRERELLRQVPGVTFLTCAP